MNNEMNRLNNNDSTPVFFGAKLTVKEYQQRKARIAQAGPPYLDAEVNVDTPTYRQALGKLQQLRSSVLTLSDWDQIEKVMVAHIGGEVTLVESVNEGLSAILAPMENTAYLVREVNGVLYVDECEVQDGKPVGVDIRTVEKLEFHARYSVMRAFAKILYS